MLYKLLIVIAAAVCMIFLGFLVVRVIPPNWINQHISRSELSPTSISYECTRTERYENPPEFDRALSLISQRIGDSSERNGFENPAVIVPCLKIEYTSAIQDFGAEGYFLFSNDSATPDNLPIYVDHSYKESDDILTAILLSHEMKHAQQYLDKLAGKPESSCMEKEVEAFYQESIFVLTLNPEELRSLGSRMGFYQNDPKLWFPVQLFQWLKKVTSVCSAGDGQCQREHLSEEIRTMVYNSHGYQQECASQQ